MRGLAILVFALAGCSQQSACESSDGVWNDCASVAQTCVDGAVIDAGVTPAVCETGCTCPAAAPVWSETDGCLTAEACEGMGS